LSPLQIQFGRVLQKTRCRFRSFGCLADGSPIASELFSSLSPDELVLRLRNERVEPDFGPPSAPRPMIQRGIISEPLRGRHGLPAGMLLYLASVALVAAAIIGSFFGSGFFLLPSTASKVITDFDHNPSRVYGGTPEADREAVLVSRETGMPHSVAVDVLPSSSPLGQHPTADEAGGAAEQSKEVQGLSPQPPMVSHSRRPSGRLSQHQAQRPHPFPRWRWRTRLRSPRKTP